MSAASPRPPRRGSPTRLAISAAFCLLSLVVAVYGGLRLAAVLEQGGYGTPAVTNALLILALSGGLLGGGVALFVWDMSLRHEEPRQ